MRVFISATGAHDPDLHYMVVDRNGVLVDLAGIQNSAVDPSSLADPSIASVTWGPVTRNGETRDAGVITKVDGTQTLFADHNLLAPYLAKYHAAVAATLAAK